MNVHNNGTASTPSGIERRAHAYAPMLGFLSLLFLAAHIFTAREFYYNNDDVHMIAKGEAAIDSPGLLFTPDKAGRIHPVTYAALGGMKRVVGWSPFPGYILMGLIHVGNVLLAFLAFRRVANSDLGAFIGCSLFLALSVHFQCVGWISETGRALALTASLLSLFQYLRFSETRHWAPLCGSVVTWLLAVWSSEEAIVLPAIFVAHHMTARPRGTHCVQHWRWVAAFAIPGAALLALTVRAMDTVQTDGYFRFGSHMGVNLLSFHRELLQSLFVPRRQLVATLPELPGLARAGVALGLMLAMGIPIMMAARRIVQSWKTFIVPYLWFLAFLAPFIARPMGWEPQARYMYAAALGGCLILGQMLATAAAQATTRRRCALSVGICISILITGAGYLDLLKTNQKASRWSDPAGIEDFITRDIPYLREAADTATANATFIVENHPFDPIRTEAAHLEAALNIYFMKGVRARFHPGEPIHGEPLYRLRWIDGIPACDRL